MQERTAVSRRYFLDWVRIGAFALLVLYHVGMYYVTWGWHVKSPFASHALEPFMLMTSPWRLSLLFFISGVATAFLFGKTPQGFLRKRSWRLLVPLVFGMLVIVPPQSYYEVVERLPGGYHDGYLAFWSRDLLNDQNFCRDGECLDVPTWNHLWFVAYLWVYTVVLCLLRWLAPKTLSNLAERVAGVFGRGIGLLLWPALFLIVVRMAMVGRFESTHALVDDWYNHAQYLPQFLLGFAVAKSQPVWDRFAALRKPAAVVSLVAYAFIACYFTAYNGDATPPDWLRDVQRVVWGTFQWSAIVAIIGFAAHWSPGDSRARRYLTEAVFPVYILHQTIIVVLAHNLQSLALRPAVEGPLLVVATFALAFAGFELVRRIAWMRPLLGLGPREPRRETNAVADAA
ncbi:acyltransferase family protein [Lysobacter auxotrophicus]|uniref:Acyltransferase family protein n=1 Tax=Lysobacter auxotrophicus TaxID=2992573 RepID=A0ABM8D9J6_9GAMM|nr:acyltransferase family protein [Lysobacter auxotrophicus]BDU15191.1 acyltransferase family protein [Lysobacter auxotrophicus]